MCDLHLSCLQYYFIWSSVCLKTENRNILYWPFAIVVIIYFFNVVMTVYFIFCLKIFGGSIPPQMGHGLKMSVWHKGECCSDYHAYIGVHICFESAKNILLYVCVCVCVCVCARACACVPACMRAHACRRGCERACVGKGQDGLVTWLTPGLKKSPSLVLHNQTLIGKY